MERKEIFLILNFSFLILNSFAQAPNWLWAKALGGSTTDQGFAITTDGIGNVYTAGFFSGTADFDPGAATFNLTTSGPGGIFVSKLDASGNFSWAKQMDGIYYSAASAIAIDDSRNIYLTGSFSGTVDFDPGAGVFNLNSAFADDIFVCKLDSSGNFIWAIAMGGSGNEKGASIAVDAAGSVYTTGHFFGIADFDPGAGVCSFTAGGGCDDIFISKLTSTGNFIWAKQIGDIYPDGARSITLDAAGNIYTTGNFKGTVDFDPGTGTFNLVSPVANIFVSKLDSAGNFIWSKAMGGASGALGMSIALDAFNNVFTTGSFVGTADFDPDAGVYNLSSTGGNDIFISRLSSSGNFIWAKNMGGVTTAGGNSLAVDASGNVFTLGYFVSTADFDPGSGIFYLTSNGDRDVFVSKLDNTGNFVWAKSFGGYGSDTGNSIALDPSGHPCVTGFFYSASVAFDAITLVNRDTVANSGDVYVSKLDNVIIAANHETENDEGILLLFPNPATTELRITNAEFKIASVEVFDALGQKYNSAFNNSLLTIDVSSLAPGIYFVKLCGEKEERVGKFVKQ